MGWQETRGRADGCACQVLGRHGQGAVASQETRGLGGPSVGKQRPRQERSRPRAGAPCRRRDPGGGRGCLRSNLRNKGFVLWAADATKGGGDTPTLSSTKCHRYHAPKCPAPLVRQRLPKGTGRGCPDTLGLVTKPAASAHARSRNPRDGQSFVTLSSRRLPAPLGRKPKGPSWGRLRGLSLSPPAPPSSA